MVRYKLDSTIAYLAASLLLAAAFGPGCGGGGNGSGSSPHPDLVIPEIPATVVGHTQQLSGHLMQAAMDAGSGPVGETLGEMYGHLAVPMLLQGQLQMANAYVKAATSREPTVASKAAAGAGIFRAAQAHELFTYTVMLGSLTITVEVRVYSEEHGEWRMTLDGTMDDEHFDDYLFVEGMTRADSHPLHGEGWYFEATFYDWEDEGDLVILRAWRFEDEELTIGEAESPYAPFITYQMTATEAEFWLYELPDAERLLAYYDIVVDVGGEAEFYCESEEPELWLEAEWTLPPGGMDLELCTHPSHCSDELGCWQFEIR